MNNDDTKYVLVTGATGQLGSDVIKELNAKNIHCIGVGSDDLDIKSDVAVYNFFNNYKIMSVIHCAAYTNVDGAETDIADNYEVNAIGTENICAECYRHNIPLMYISTDYVFDGEKDSPYVETDTTHPLCEYGNAKLLGEKAVSKLDKYFIVRISWVFGKNGKNFVKTMLELSKTKNEISVVCDQVGSPTYTKDLAKLLVDMIQTDKYGIYHATNEGYVSWSDFARKIFEFKNISVKINDISSSEYKVKAKRPQNSRLDKSKLVENGFQKLPLWEDALKRFLVEMEN